MSDLDYQRKYYKYKNKYLNLKNSTGGAFLFKGLTTVKDAKPANESTQQKCKVKGQKIENPDGEEKKSLFGKITKKPSIRQLIQNYVDCEGTKESGKDLQNRLIQIFPYDWRFELKYAIKGAIKGVKKYELETALIRAGFDSSYSSFNNPSISPSNNGPKLSQLQFGDLMEKIAKTELLFANTYGELKAAGFKDKNLTVNAIEFKKKYFSEGRYNLNYLIAFLIFKGYPEEFLNKKPTLQDNPDDYSFDANISEIKREPKENGSKIKVSFKTGTGKELTITYKNKPIKSFFEIAKEYLAKETQNTIRL